MRELCRRFRKDAGDAEQLLWRLLRNRGTAGAKFRRQHPVGRYILDFYCHDARLAVELDGGQHARFKQIQHDEERTRYLKQQGIEVLRFWNNDVLERTESVVEVIWSTIMSLPPNPLSEGKRLREGSYIEEKDKV